MQKDNWYSLNNKKKEIRDRLDDESKAFILGYGNTNSPNNIPKPNNATSNEVKDNKTMLINAANSSTGLKIPPGDVRSGMSKSSTRFVNQVEYCVSKHNTTNCAMSLLTAVQMVESLEMMFVSYSRQIAQ
jgi:hypothetical protein